MKKFVIIVFFFIAFNKNNLNAIIESDVFPELTFYSALEEVKLDRIKMFLEKGMSPNKLDINRMSPLAYAIKGNSKPLIDLLISYKAEINKTILNKISLIIYSIMIKKENLIPILVEKGADLNFQDEIGRTALMIAIEENSLNGVLQIINFDNDLSLRDLSGKNAYDYSKLSRNKKIKQILQSLNQ